MASSGTRVDARDRALLDAVARRRVQRARLEIDDLTAALEWALAHPAIEPEPYAAAAKARPIVNAGWIAERSDAYDVQSAEANLVYDDPFIPAVDWAAYAPFAAALGRSTLSGRKLLTDALVLHFRLPRLWSAVTRGRVEVWRARRIAQAIRMRPADVAEYVDAKVTPLADSIGVAKLDALIDEAMLRLHAEERELELAAANEAWGVEFAEDLVALHDGSNALVAQLNVRGDVKDLKDFHATASEIARILGLRAHTAGEVPESLEVRKARAVGILADPAGAATLLADPLAPTPAPRRTELVIHVTSDVLTGRDPIARVEGPLRTRLAQQVAEWLGGATHFTVQPVIDLNVEKRSSSLDVTASMGRRARLRTPTCAFPYCDRPASKCDVDHVTPSARGGPATDMNLVPLCRHHHRLKTHAGWNYTVLEANAWLWRDPHGRQYFRQQHSTTDVSTTRLRL